MICHGVSLFIPIYNASRSIRRALKRSYQLLSEAGLCFEIILVDDNSTDKSYRFRRVIERTVYPRGREMKYLFYNRGPSRRENLGCSLLTAQYDIICFIDVDFSCDVSYVLVGIKRLMEEGADIVVGSRYVKGAKVRRRWGRRILSFFYNAAIRLFFLSRIRDHQCGLKVFRKEALTLLLPQMGYDEKYVRGWFWDAELLIRAQRARLKVIEMPVVWNYSKTSSFSLFREQKCIQSIVNLKRELVGTSPKL